MQFFRQKLARCLDYFPGAVPPLKHERFARFQAVVGLAQLLDCTSPLALWAYHDFIQCGATSNQMQ